MSHQTIVSMEIKRLTLEIALLRYDLRQLLAVSDLTDCVRDVCTAIAIRQEQKILLQQGNYSQLHYSIKMLYNMHKLIIDYSEIA